MRPLHIANLTVLLAFPIWSQQPPTFSAQSDLVLLDVGAKDRNGGFVSNLKKENFKIFENGQPQTISQFSSDDLPVTAGLVIDNSFSMRSKRTEVITAGLAFSASSNRNDEIFVTHFNDSVRSSLPQGVLFTGDISKLRTALISGPAEGRTALYDAIVFSLKHLESGKQDRKVLVLVSDGGDNASTHDFKDVMPAVRRSRATIYTVGLFDEDDPDRNPGLLRRLARAHRRRSVLSRAGSRDRGHLPPDCEGYSQSLQHRLCTGPPGQQNGSANHQSGSGRDKPQSDYPRPYRLSPAEC